jgi:dTDP-glucose 4,6-dehydratase
VDQDPLRASSPYSASKAAADLMVLAYCTTFGLRATITRGANNVGPYQFLEKVLPLFATNAMLNEPLPMYGDGKQRRDYTHVADHCSGVLTVLEKGILGEVYNLEMAEIVLQTLRKPRTLIRHVTDRPGHDRRYCMNVDKLRALGWRPEMAPPRAVEQAVRWYADNRWWWEPLRAEGFQAYYSRQYGQRLVQGQP